MALPKEKLEKFKKLLLEERKMILEDFIDSSDDFKDLAQDSSGDLVDQAYNYYEKNLLIGLSGREKDTLKKIDEALKRIEDGSFGYCEATKKPIEEERLEAIPYTTLCMEEAMRRQQKERFKEM